MHDVLKWVASLMLFVLFLWVAALNGRVFYTRHIRRRDAPSWIPLLGGITGVLALLVAPVDGLSRWCFVPLLLDWGSLPGLLYTIVFHMRRRHKESD